MPRLYDGISTISSALLMRQNIAAANVSKGLPSWHQPSTTLLNFSDSWGTSLTLVILFNKQSEFENSNRWFCINGVGLFFSPQANFSDLWLGGRAPFRESYVTSLKKDLKLTKYWVLKASLDERASLSFTMGTESESPIPAVNMTTVWRCLLVVSVSGRRPHSSASSYSWGTENEAVLK